MTEFCFQPALQPPWQRKAKPVRQRSGGFRLKKSETKNGVIALKGLKKAVKAPEHGPPAEISKEVVRTGLLQGVVMRQRVVHPPVGSG